MGVTERKILESLVDLKLRLCGECPLGRACDKKDVFTKRMSARESWDDRRVAEESIALLDHLNVEFFAFSGLGMAGTYLKVKEKWKQDYREFLEETIRERVSEMLKMNADVSKSDSLSRYVV